MSEFTYSKSAMLAVIASLAISTSFATPVVADEKNDCFSQVNTGTDRYDDNFSLLTFFVEGPKVTYKNRDCQTRSKPKVRTRRVLNRAKLPVILGIYR